MRNCPPNKGARGRPAFVLRRHSPLPDAVNRLIVIFQFFRKREGCSWEIQQRNEGATVSIVSRSSFLFYWRDGSRPSLSLLFPIRFSVIPWNQEFCATGKPLCRC